jgi:hypothetical protein
MAAVMLVFCRLVIIIYINGSSRSASRDMTELSGQRSCTEEGLLMRLQVFSLLHPPVLYMQYALILASVTGFELLAPLAYPLQALAWAWSPAVPETLSIECILRHGSSSSSSIPVSIQPMLFYLAMPFAMLLLLLAVEIVWLFMCKAWLAASTTVTSCRDQVSVAAVVVC